MGDEVNERFGRGYGDVCVCVYVRGSIWDKLAG